MDAYLQIENALDAALRPLRDHSPPRLAQALGHAVFPGGARFRPRLCVAVAAACGDAHPRLALAGAVAVELLHCASLIYDDLPCFDDAEIRRGQPAVHAAYGEALAILAGNALIVRSFELVSEHITTAPLHASLVLAALSRGAGAPHGITAGQAWESEPRIDLRAYHRAKTGALFEAAVIAGAVAGGGDAKAWRGLGDLLGEAYQIADDLRDAIGHSELMGKPVGQDVAHQRPSAVDHLGARGSLGRIDDLLREVPRAVPRCAGRETLVAFLRAWAESLRPATATLPRAAAPALVASAS